MAVFSGPEIVNNGLVFYYDVSNTQRSWKGAPTTNLYTDGDFSSGNLHPVRYGTWQIVPDPRDSFKRVLKATPFANNQYHGRDIPVTISTAYSLQMEVFVSPDFDGTNVQMYPEQGGGGANKLYDLTKKGTWQILRFDGKAATTTNIRMLAYVLSSFTTGYVLISNVQVEQQPYATPFVNDTRSNTQAILDLSGNNIITATSLSYNANNTFTFDGANNYIEISKTRTGLGITNTYSLEAVFRRSSNLAGKIILGGQGYNWGIMTTTNGCRAEHWYSSNGGTTWNYFTTGDAVAPINTWTHVVATFNHLGNMCTYINGRLVITANMSAYTNNWMNTPICIGGYNYFDYRFNGLIPLAKVYNRELTANEISQNFEAIRGRYGI